MDLADIHEELVHEIRDRLHNVAEMTSVAELAGIFDELTAELEGLAICHLVEEADVGVYRENLARAGHARRLFLRRSALEKNTTDRHLALSRNRGFLDAVVAGALPLARDIATLSQAAFDPSWEYEDDYLFYRALHLIALADKVFPAAELLAIATRFEEVLEGAKAFELDVVVAFAEKDRQKLEAALDGLVAIEQKKNDKAMGSARVLEHDILYWPSRRVSIVALAILKLAELAGLKIDKEFPLCPPLGKVPWTEKPFRDLFEEIERLP